MKRFLLVFAGAAMLSGLGAFASEVPSGMVQHFADASKPSVTYGRVKEMTAGQKITLDVDNAVDKTFDLTDKTVATKVASGLKVGDPVKITEWSDMGKTKRVQIVKHAAAGVKHGDKTAAQEKAAATK